MIKLLLQDVQGLRLVDACDLHKQTGEIQPFGLWFHRLRRGLPELIEGVNIVRRHGPQKRTYVTEAIASELLMMSRGEHAHEYRRHLIENMDLWPPSPEEYPPGLEGLLGLFYGRK